MVRAVARLENVFQSDLHFAVVQNGRVDAPEVGRPQRTAGPRELRRVQKIESLIAELNLPFFAHTELFEEREIPRLLRRSVEQRNAGVAVTLGAEERPFPCAAVALRTEKRRRI